ncbi:MAG: BatD family protein [Desulfobacteraceae bacterium]|nr:BatD family protein [Desulfobacteraceae bacterium]
MKAWILWIGLCLALLPGMAGAGGDVQVSAQVDRTHIEPGESLQLRIVVRNGQGDVDLASLPDFRVISQGTSSSMQVVNGNVSQETTSNYLLIPKRQGQLTIPALDVSVGGRVYKTDPITIQVAAQSSSRPEERVRDVWVQADVSETRPYAGQQVRYTFTLFQAVQVTDATFNPPDFKGFTTKELKERPSYNKIINGRDYRLTQIVYILTPLQAGRATIEPGTLQLSMIRLDTRRPRSPFDDFFNAPFFNRRQLEPKVLQSQPLEIDVQPLPLLPANETFSGLVGRFNMTAEVDKTQLAVGDSTTLAITLAGQGNISDAQAPALKLPEVLKTYADAPEEKIDLTPQGYNGQKVFRTALVPVQPGEVALPAVRVTYFDIEQKAYRTLTATLPALKVQAGSEAAAAPVTVSPEGVQPHKQTVTFTGRDILPLKEGLDALQTVHPLGWPVFLLWILSPALLFGLLVAAQRLGRQDLRPSARMRAKAEQALKSARPSADAPQTFLTALYQALTAAILARAGRGGEALTWREAEEMLIARGEEGENAKQAAQLLTTIESAKFSGAHLTLEQQTDLLRRTREMVTRLAP